MNHFTLRSNQSAAANRRPAGQSDGSGNLAATVAADRAFPAAVAELGSFCHEDQSQSPSSGGVRPLVLVACDA